MCGISGAVALSSRARGAIDLRRIALTMSYALRHRGPDGDGVWCEPGNWAAFAHRRLAVVDLSPRGQQPMSRPGSSRVICFNGEIYNFRALRRELEAKGVTFYTGTDTEVILAATEAWGIEEALHRMDGPFAFALWDGSSKTLHLARDRAGEKPLLGVVIRDHLLFASELRALLAGGCPSRLSAAAVRRYLEVGYVPEPLSMVDGVFKLPAGYYVTIRAIEGESSVLDARQWLVERSRRYWRLPDRQRPLGGEELNITAATGAADELLATAVREQLACDVPVGVFLSGGVDSTLVAATVRDVASRSVSAFTVRFGQGGYDESEHAGRVARYLGLDHHVLELPADGLVNSVEKEAQDADEPTANASYFAVLAMSRLARQYVTVVLSGDGGDEVFAGYNRYRQLFALSRCRRNDMMRKGLASLLRAAERCAGGLRVLERVRLGSMPQSQLAVVLGRAARFLAADVPEEAYRAAMRMTTDESLRRLGLTDRAGVPSWWSSDAPLLGSMLEDDFLNYLPGDNLAKIDRASMRAALEVRLPLLDRELVEFAWMQPDAFLIRGGQSKVMLRRMLTRKVPRQLFERPKMGFTVPVQAWLVGPLRDWIRDLLLDENICREVGLEPRRVAEVLKDFEGGRSVDARFLWGLGMLVAWVRGIRAATVMEAGVKVSGGGMP